mmetsp:Transcript_2694/g.4713  ORF Transcript_2694/g.4713 Transcript_2694/m.4713 type:complete len:339 (+) Transcript_2694:599-1615(+)|eukprot:CAMPEP_0184697188 /NCGR_PEP_ID=MMETSP0313-20130426/4227_1 /TAXON_ID=2792 /ORGANISM="Porphyridium aerugineum, Strain SAG 1380-2" /LENGTH=338 /DNA_ID=CAMNT_0027155951 /DNA_START=190 /DNA_END=1206 /DNA_ORIENTATION=-
MGIVKATNRTVDFSNAQQPVDDDAFFFVVVADPQIGMIQMNESWDEELELCKRAVREINRLKPNFVIVVGDLVNAHPNIYPNFPNIQEVTRQQTQDYLDAFNQVDNAIPVLNIAGNHDIGQTVTKQSIDDWRADFGDDYYSFWAPMSSSNKKVLGIVLNSQLMEDTSEESQAMNKEQMTWLESTLRHSRALDQPVDIIVFIHIPPFLRQPDEVDFPDGFTMYKGFKLGDSYFHLKNAARQPLIKLLDEYGVWKIFAGHWHQNNDPTIAVLPNGNCQVIVSSALGGQLTDRTKSGVCLVQVDKSDDSKRRRNAIHQVYVELDDLVHVMAEKGRWHVSSM